MLHPSSGTGCQTSFTKQKILLAFRGSWSHICVKLCDPLTPSPVSFPHVFLPLLSHSTPHLTPHPPTFHFLCQAQRAWGFPAWRQTALNKWTLTLTLTLKSIQLFSPSSKQFAAVLEERSLKTTHHFPFTRHYI